MLRAEQQPPAPFSLDVLAENAGFLSSANVVTEAPVDGRRLWRATHDDGTRKHDAAVETADGSGPDRRDYRFNVAAYELDRLLGLTLVAPSVERLLKERPASLTWWVDNFAMHELDRRRRGVEPPDR
jgi:hypothetical protein